MRLLVSSVGGSPRRRKVGLKHPNCPKCGRRMMRMDNRRAFGEIWFCAGCGWKGSRGRIAEEKRKEEVKEE